MKKTETRKYDMLLRVRDFGAAHAADFPANTVGNRLFSIVVAATGELATHAVVQASATVRQSVTSKGAIREALLDDLETINHTAKAIAKEIPNLEDKFHMPRGSGDLTVLNAAKVFLVDATPLKTAFLSYALPPDFLENLQASITNFEAAMTTRNTSRSTRIAATASINESLRRGLQAVQQLKAVVKNLYHDNPAALAEWASASHIERSGPAANAKPDSLPSPPAVEKR